MTEVYRYNRNSQRRISPEVYYERAKLMWEERTKQNFTLEKIGKVFGLTRERVRQILDDYKLNLNERRQALDN